MKRNFPLPYWIGKRIILSLDKRERVHFLHISKTAGGQIKHICRQLNDRSSRTRIMLHGHQIGLCDIPSTERFFFSIRSPETRFLSGFHYQKRKNRIDRTFPYQSRAFDDFTNANDLAEHLFEDSVWGRRAVFALKSVKHCSWEQIGWFDRVGYFLEERPPIHIIRQEEFEKDLDIFLKKIGNGVDVSLTDDRAIAKRTNYGELVPLSEKAEANLRAWYRVDFEFYKLCSDWIAENS